MSKIKVGINGLGRIGRTVIREWFKRQGELAQQLEIVAVNNPGQLDTYAHLIRYDSVHGPFPSSASVRHEDQYLFIDDKRIRFFSEPDPAKIPWSECQVDVVIDATGKFKDKENLGKHLGKTVKKVIMCAPGKDLDGTFVMGVNHSLYEASTHHIISNASCTTNCLAPVAKVLHDRFGIENGFMVTVHSYTSDQNLLDGTHKDLRRARAAALSMIPTTTGAAKSLGLIIPELKGKLDGYAVRVPTPNVSLVDLTVVLKQKISKEEINQALKEASLTSPLQGILGYTEEELISTDFNGMKESSMVDASLTSVIGQTAKVIAWYDNEVGFSNRVLDLAKFII